MTFTKEALVGIIVLLVVIGGIVWYGATHGSLSSSPTATSTPAVTGPLHLTESTELYDIDASYPSSTVLAETVNAEADASAVAAMKAFETDAIAEFKPNWVDLPPDFLAHLKQDNLKGSLKIEYKTYQSAHTVSYVFLIYQDTLGAHPNTFYRTFVFDISTGKTLSIGDLFVSSTDYLKTLSTISRNELPSMIAERESVSVSQVDMGMLEDGTAPEEANFQNFYLDGHTFVLLFPPYQVGPYVLGSLELDLSTSEIPGLKMDYQ